MRGLGQGFTGKWGDELIPLLTPDASDDTGIPRNYAAGSAYNDLRNNERAENQEAADKYPGNFYTGQALGALPSAVATGGAAGEGVAANALLAGARGGLEGAGGGTEGNRAMGAAWGAGPSAVLGGLGAGVAKAAPYIKDLFKNGPPGGPPLAPAMATVGGEAAPEASEIARGAAAARGASSQSAAELGGPIINRATTAAPPLPPPGQAPKNTVPLPRRGPSMADREMAGGRPLGPEETVTRTPAIPPPSSLAAEAAGAEAIPAPRIPTELSTRMPAISRAGKTPGEFVRAQRDALENLLGPAPTKAELIARRGPSMADALAEENSADQLARLPPMNSEYAEAGANAGARRAAQNAARGKTTPWPPPSQALKTPIGELTPGRKPSANPSGEFRLSSKPALGKKTDVKALMKKRADDEE